MSQKDIVDVRLKFLIKFGKILIPDDGKWNVIAENIDHEAWLVHDLNPSSNYQFRLLAMNKIGWSIPGFPTNNVTTKLSGKSSN